MSFIYACLPSDNLQTTSQHPVLEASLAKLLKTGLLDAVRHAGQQPKPRRLAAAAAAQTYKRQTDNPNPKPTRWLRCLPSLPPGRDGGARCVCEGSDMFGQKASRSTVLGEANGQWSLYARPGTRQKPQNTKRPFRRETRKQPPTTKTHN